MCVKCVEEGKMTQAELDVHTKEGVDLVHQIMDLCEGKFEEVVLNSLISCIINVTNDIGIPPLEVMTALALGFKQSGADILSVDLHPTIKTENKWKES